MFGNNILPTSGPKEVDPITIANIQRQSQDREYEIVEDSIGRVKLKNYTSEDSELSKVPGLCQYYCSLCGYHVLVTNKNLAEAKRRRSDLALIVDYENQFCKYMKKGEIIRIRRENGIEQQWKWNCGDCGVEIAYQSYPHDYMLSNEIGSGKVPQIKDALYVINKSLATDASYCEVLEEAQKIKQKRNQ